MAYFVYLIASKSKKKTITYVGYTKNLKKRLYLHNTGKGAKFTKGRFWKVLYKEKHSSKKKAMIREYQVKKNARFRKLIKIDALAG